MFLFGILSTPFLYLLVAFSYVIATSFGVFPKTEDGLNDDTSTSNIINYEKLNSSENIKPNDNCNYGDYIVSSEIINSCKEKPVIETPLIEILPLDNSNKNYTFYSSFCFSNRPPPSIV
ncbi:MAG: hypothetical protein PF541_17535 [Prolixibacteraceae bacterium]|nr:hypothetical protein [Prolixibacteraceae bacterium]